MVFVVIADCVFWAEAANEVTRMNAAASVANLIVPPTVTTLASLSESPSESRSVGERSALWNLQWAIESQFDLLSLVEFQITVEEQARAQSSGGTSPCANRCATSTRSDRPCCCADDCTRCSGFHHSSLVATLLLNLTFRPSLYRFFARNIANAGNQRPPSVTRFDLVEAYENATMHSAIDIADVRLNFL